MARARSIGETLDRSRITVSGVDMKCPVDKETFDGSPGPFAQSRLSRTSGNFSKGLCCPQRARNSDFTSEPAVVYSLRGSRMTARRTIVVHTKLSGHMIRVAAARSGANGVQVMTMGQLAGRLAGGFLQPIDPEKLQEAVRTALAGSSLGEFDAIKDLPGMVRAAVSTLDKVWRADIDLSAATNPRLMALHTLEAETLRRLPPSMKRPKELVELACGRIRHAPAVIGPVEIHGHSEMSPCWRPLLAALTTTVPVVWVAGSRSTPSWLDAMKIDIRREAPKDPELRLVFLRNSAT